MTTDLSSKTVKQLRRMAPGHDDLLHDCVTGEAADELARRLEEAQQQIVAQQAKLDTEIDILDKIKEAAEKGGSIVIVLNQDAAHDTKLVAEAKAEALEEAAREAYKRNPEDVEASKAIISFQIWIETKAAEYRAEAGRKE